jgi:multidrug efflux pump subunit AcrA (membrane-fusion protein)
MKIIRKAFGSPLSRVLVLGLGVSGSLSIPAIVRTTAAQVGPSPSAPSGNKPATAKVEKGPLKVDVTLSGVFEAKRIAEVSIRPKSWTMPLVVDRAIELGTPVKKGDVLVEFARDKIDRAIQDAEVENTLTELALKHAAEELPILAKSLPVEMAAAERAKSYADEDLKNFAEIERPMSERMAHFNVKSDSEWLEYAREELRQLEKMYRSKDLTEETEEIILRRQRFRIETDEFYLKEAEQQRDLTLKIRLPRDDQRVRENAVKQAIELERARALLPLNLNQKRLALAKLKHDRDKGAEKLAELKSDREAMTVRAPADGLVYYGRPERGHWPSAAGAAQKLHKGGVIPPDEVFITVVAPRPIEIRATVEEKDLAALNRPTELKGRATPASDPDLHLGARLASIVTVPREAGKFDTVIDVELGDDQTAIKPGMACSVKFTTYRKDDSVTVPSGAVFEDDATDTPSHYVYLSRSDKDGKHPRRPVKTGKSASGKTEILEGLAEGDEILASRPAGQ